MTEEKLKAALILDDANFTLPEDFVKFNQSENISLKILEKGQGRKIFLENAKKLLLSNKEQKAFTQEDIKGLEEELDLVIKLGDNNSLEDSIVTGVNYAEIVFIKKDQEDFKLTDYQAAVDEFKNRQRNFGA